MKACVHSWAEAQKLIAEGYILLSMAYFVEADPCTPSYIMEKK